MIMEGLLYDTVHEYYYSGIKPVLFYNDEMTSILMRILL